MYIYQVGLTNDYEDFRDTNSVASARLNMGFYSVSTVHYLNEFDAGVACSKMLDGNLDCLNKEMVFTDKLKAYSKCLELNLQLLNSQRAELQAIKKTFNKPITSRK